MILVTCFVNLKSGHGGIRAAEFVKKNLFSNLMKHPKFTTDIRSAIGRFAVCFY